MVLVSGDHRHTEPTGKIQITPKGREQSRLFLFAKPKKLQHRNDHPAQRQHNRCGNKRNNQHRD